MSRDSLISAALRKLSAISKGVAIDATDTTNGAEALNAMLKTFQVKGMPLWAVRESTTTLAATNDYYFGIGQVLNIPAPLKVYQATLKDTVTGEQIPLNVTTHYDYNLLPDPTNPGTPNTYWYEPRNQIGILHLWPQPDTTAIANKQVTVTYQRPFEDMTAAGDTLDFPQHWHEAVIYGLAWRLAPEYGIPLQDRGLLKSDAQMMLDDALSFGTEEGSMFLSPDWQRG